MCFRGYGSPKRSYNLINSGENICLVHFFLNLAGFFLRCPQVLMYDLDLNNLIHFIWPTQWYSIMFYKSSDLRTKFVWEGLENWKYLYEPQDLWLKITKWFPLIKLFYSPIFNHFFYNKLDKFICWNKTGWFLSFRFWPHSSIFQLHLLFCHEFYINFIYAHLKTHSICLKDILET